MENQREASSDTSVANSFTAPSHLLETTLKPLRDYHLLAWTLVFFGFGNCRALNPFLAEVRPRAAQMPSQAKRPGASREPSTKVRSICEVQLRPRRSTVSPGCPSGKIVAERTPQTQSHLVSGKFDGPHIFRQIHVFCLARSITWSNVRVRVSSPKQDCRGNEQHQALARATGLNTHSKHIHGVCFVGLVLVYFQNQMYMRLSNKSAPYFTLIL